MARLLSPPRMTVPMGWHGSQWLLRVCPPRSSPSMDLHVTSVSRDRKVSVYHPGVLATKVRYFGVKSTNVYLVQMGTRPAKVAHRPSWPTKAAKPGLFPETEDLFAKTSSIAGERPGL